MQHKIDKTRYVLCIVARWRRGEERVFEGVPYPYSVCGVKSEQLTYEVEERPVVVVDRNDDLLYVNVKISTHDRNSQFELNAPRVA